MDGITESGLACFCLEASTKAFIKDFSPDSEMLCHSDQPSKPNSLSMINLIPELASQCCCKFVKCWRPISWSSSQPFARIKTIHCKTCSFPVGTTRSSTSITSRNALCSPASKKSCSSCKILAMDSSEQMRPTCSYLFNRRTGTAEPEAELLNLDIVAKFIQIWWIWW